MALRLLRESRGFADRSTGNPWLFALERRLLIVRGSSPNALRWLAKKGFVEHKVEITLPGASRRRFREVALLSFEDRSCFLLTDKGLAFALQIASREEEFLGASQGTSGKREATAGSLNVLPLWEPEPRRLWVGDRLLHHYKRPAPYQELLLTAFQEANWLVEIIDDPIPPTPNGDSRKRLENAVRGLNHCQHPRMLEFHVLNDGTAVAWKWFVEEKNAKRKK